MILSRRLASAWVLLGLLQTASLVDGQGAAPAAVVQDPDWIDKVLGIVGASDPPIQNQKQRFQQYLLYMAGPLPLLGEAAGSGLNQWTDTPPEWGQGWGAYGKRFGSNLGYNAVRQTITYGTASVLGEDTRYFPSHKQGFKSRVFYAVASTVEANRSDGRRTFSVSSVAGIVGASAISSIWGPDSYKGAGHIAKNAGISFGVTAAFNLVREFLPDILQRPVK